MIKVQYWNGADGSRNLQMQGHAGAAPRGQDLVCAGASTLALTLGRAAALMEEEEMLARPALVRLEAGGHCHQRAAPGGLGCRGGHRFLDDSAGVKPVSPGLSPICPSERR